MKKWIALFLWGIGLTNEVVAQEIPMTEMASLEQVQEEGLTSDGLVSMNDLGMDDGGYVLYETVIDTGNEATLEIENVRDYASVYLDGKLVGELDNENRILNFPTSEGEHLLQLYAENTGRITYGPEILDNSKGLFGTAELDGSELTEWKIIPLAVHACDVNRLVFSPLKEAAGPCFYRCTFSYVEEKDVYLDMRGWGIGEVWLNGEYLGSYWEKNSQQSLLIQAAMLNKEENSILIFELKNKGEHSIHLSDKPIFK